MIAFMGMQCCFHAYTTRIALNMAITQMVEPEKAAEVESGCEADADYYNTTARQAGESYDWCEWKQGIILGAFFWGYVITHLPAGVISDKFGARHVVGGGMSLSIVLTLLTPVIITSSDGNWIVLSFVRVGQGLGQGVVFPGLSTLMAKWLPPRELSLLGTLMFCGMMLGAIVGNVVNGNFMWFTECWSSIFYLWGAIAVTWIICWYILCFSTPDDSPYISQKELTLLHEQLGSNSPESVQIPWKHIFTSVPVYAFIVAQVCCDWGFYTIVTDLPKYLNDVLKFDLKTNGLWNSVPFIFMLIISLTSAVICHLLLYHNICTVTFARKLFTVIGCFVPAIFLISASYAGCNKILTAWLFVLSTGFMGATICGIKVNAVDLSPRFSGTLMALNNGIAAFMGIFAPFVAGALTPNHSMDEWRIVFWINFAIMVTAGIIYGIWASAKLQWWNDAASKPEEPT